MRDATEVALRTCESLGCPRAVTVAVMVRYEEWDQLCELSCRPEDYLGAEAYAKAAAVTSLLKKCEDLPTSFDRDAAALRAFMDGERDCYHSNERLARYLPDLPRSEDEVPGIAKFFCDVRKTVGSWIGSRPSELNTLSRFGPGSTYSDPGIRATVPDKMNSTPSLTREVLWHLPQWLETSWGRACVSASRSPDFVKGNRFAVVPKDATKGRGIAAEPSINGFFQLGLGTQLRRRLRSSTGIDLDHAQDIHVQVAREASITGHLATLDLKNASGSLCRNLVRLSVPSGWASELEDLRSPFMLVEGRWIKLEQFSSMGNGYTFELETIIFMALCHEALLAVGITPVLGLDLYTFGDDIIVPTGGVRAVTAVLEFCGFKLNEKKSFSEGPFRESCGGDYYDGLAVRPYHVKETPKEPQDYIKLANGLRALETRLRAINPKLSLKRSWFYILDQIPRNIRSCRGPQALGDIVIHDDQERWIMRGRRSIRYVRVYRPARLRSVPYRLFDPDVVLACATYGCGTDEPKIFGSRPIPWHRVGVTPRDAVLGYKVGWVPYS